MVRKSAWLLSAALVAIPNTAFAQNNDTGTQATQPSPTEQAGVTPQAQAAVQSQDNNEIIITAQGRRQVLQDVPIAVTAVGGDEMKYSGASDIRQLNQLAPSLLVSSTGSEANGSARIRGIGTVGDNPGLESSVAVFIDGVYRARSGVGLTELGEVDRVEVLRGPQGTLFGRNASAGILNIITKKPRFTPEVYGEATIGNYNLKRLAGGITGPLSDVLAARLDAVWVKRDGFYNDPANHTTINNRNRFFTRGQLLYQPSDKLSVRLIGDYRWRKERCCAAVYVDNSVNSNIGNLNEVANPLLQPGAVPARTNDSGNNIVNVLRDLGQNLNALHSGYSRTVSVTPGRDYHGTTKDCGCLGRSRIESRRRDADLDHGLSRTIMRTRAATSTTAPSTSCIALRAVRPQVQYIQPGAEAPGQCVQRPSGLAGRRLLRERGPRRCTTTSGSATNMVASPRAASCRRAAFPHSIRRLRRAASPRVRRCSARPRR